MLMRDQIAMRLRQGLEPDNLEVIDESNQHAGHAGARPGGETHFRVLIGSPLFAGKSRVACHRMVNDLLRQEMQASVHALAIEIRPAKMPG